MKVTTKWLKEYVDFDLNVDELADLLATSGTEAESIVAIGARYENVVVGQIKSIEAHPNADRLSYCQVELPDGVANIVCGAKNILVGQKVPVALPGAVLPGGLMIKKSKLRGLVSEGMLCSGVELGISEEASGILTLPDDTPVGQPIRETLELEDYIMELEITPNRPDCMSVIGIAREVAALTGAELRYPKIEAGNTQSPGHGSVEVDIADPDLCDRYVARVARNVKVAPSPTWLVNKLEACGIRSINNVVDVTNYVLLEMGQPLHAFDFGLLKGAHIIVRRAGKGEKLITIDHVTRKLNPEMLVIADSKHPVALAGVMGGFDTEISEKTTEVLIESAAFAPANIRKTSRSLGLISESSLRFEKGVDVERVAFAADRAAQLMAEIAGADITAATVEAYPRMWTRPQIRLWPERVGKVLGAKIEPSKVAGYLRSLELDVKKSGSDILVTPPGFRRDLAREIDLIEEVARLYGLNNLPVKLPAARQDIRGYTELQKFRRVVAESLRASGVSETLSYSFISVESIVNLGLETEHPWLRMVKVTNPLSEEQAVMRTTLWPGLMTAAVTNINRGNENLALFEQGNIFFAVKNKEPEQRYITGILLTGDAEPGSWDTPKRSFDFYDTKGVVEALLRELRVDDYHIRPALHSALSPGAIAEVVVSHRVVGVLGQLHPRAQAAWGLKQPVFVAQIETDALFANSQPPYFHEITRFPAIELDLALVVDEGVAADHIEALLRETGGKLLSGARVFDVYRGEGIAEGSKSIAFSLQFASAKRTLTDDEVSKVVARMTSVVAKQLGATVRS